MAAPSWPRSFDFCAVGIEPGGVRRLERREIPVGRRPAAGAEVLTGPVKQRPHQAVERAIVDPVGVQENQRPERVLRQQAVARQLEQVDQIGIAREGGEALVG